MNGPSCVDMTSHSQEHPHPLSQPASSALSEEPREAERLLFEAQDGAPRLGRWNQRRTVVCNEA